MLLQFFTFKLVPLSCLLLSLQHQPALCQASRNPTLPDLRVLKSFCIPSVVVKGKSVLPDKNEPPPSGKNWLIVIAEFTSSEPSTWISLDTVRVLDGSGTPCTPIGIMEDTVASLLFYDVQMAYGAKLLALTFEDRPVYSEIENDTPRLELFRKGKKYLLSLPAPRTVPIQLLFAISPEANKLQLEFGAATMDLHCWDK